MIEREDMIVGGWGIVLAACAHAFVGLAQTWNLGPWVRPVHQVLGGSTWPLVTALAVGLPIGAMFFAAARFIKPASAAQLALLAGPFAALQVASLAGGSNVYTLAYALLFTAAASAGTLAWKAVHRSRANSR